MKRITLIFALLCTAAITSAQSLPESTWPSSYRQLQEKVYQCSCLTQTINSLYEKAQTDALSYSGTDQQVLIASCDYLRGLDYYYRNDIKNASAFYEKGIAEAKKSIDDQKTAAALTIYSRLIMQNAAIKDMGYQLRWIPKLPGFLDEAMKLDSTYTPAFVMRYTYMCYIPAPYGSYKDGPTKILSLLDSKWEKTTEDLFNIECAAAYAYSHNGNKESAKQCYLKALEYYPSNSEVLKSIQSLK